jgi:hypothetical protein
LRIVLMTSSPHDSGVLGAPHDVIQVTIHFPG